MKRVAVFGGRDYPHKDRVYEAMRMLWEKHGPFEMVIGWCNCEPDEPDIGADYFAYEWARGVNVATKAFTIAIEGHPADWEKHDRGLGQRNPAGPIRNREMATSGLDGAVQFPGGRGTRSMRAECDKAGVPVWER